MRLNAGARLGPYEVIAPLGAGGMGEVYRARDTRLGRDVAIKVLPQHLSENPEVHARFEREARAISSLNHPHICTLHDVGREGGVEYLVMELIEGQTLSERLKSGPLPIPEVLRLGIQIADALDRAHRSGIVHRDFKPGNVMLTKSGAKLMDFGLARPAGMGGTAGGSGVTVAHLTQSPTVASPLTAAGTIVGTFLYMAPEQLEGREVDARGDIWALGCVLYEMATGRHAFDGKSQASLVGAIMNTEPPTIASVAAAATGPEAPPPALDALVRACLAKDPNERIQTAHDVKLQLTWIAQAGSQSGIASPAGARRRLRRGAVAWAAGLLLASLAAFLAGRRVGGGQDNGGTIRFTIPIPRSMTSISMPRVSPDGRVVAFAGVDSSGRTMIWLRPLNSLTANPLPGTEGSRAPFWSPDSRYLAFIADGKLKKIAVAGGPPIVVCDAPSGSDGSWGAGGTILFDGGDADPIRRVDAGGGIASAAMPLDSATQVGWPAFLPDGKRYIFTSFSAGQPPELMLGRPGDPKGRRLGVTGSRVEYSRAGYLLFARERTLLAQRFDVSSLKLQGEPVPVAEDLPVSGNGQANFTVSNNDVLVYRATGTVLSQLEWVDRSGREVERLLEPADFRAPALSPDGSRIAIRRVDSDGNNLDVWLIDPARGAQTRFTFDPGPDGNPVWSPDGSRIAWTSSAGDSDAVMIKSASGLGAAQRITKLANSAVLDWSRDGQYLLVQSGNPRTRGDIFLVPVTGDHTPQPLIQTPFNEIRAHFSPDERWIAYQSDESGRPEVYVTSFHGTPGKWQVSTNGGSDPCWSHDGRELFYLSPDQYLMTMRIPPGPAFTPSTPQQLFRVTTEVSPRRNVYDVTPDGKRFLFLVPAGETNTPMTVVVNWRAALERP